MRGNDKHAICFYCDKEDKCSTDNFCDYKKYSPTPEVIANFPNGSSAKWNHSWGFTRRLIYLRDKRKCHFCDKMIMGKNYEIHHLKRRQFKGSNHPRNLVCACIKCHKITLASYTEKRLIKWKKMKTNKEFWKGIGVIK